MRNYINKGLLLLPLIAKENDKYNDWITPGFIGVYYKDTNKPHWEEKIIVVYDTAKMPLKAILNWESSKFRYETYSELNNGIIYRIFAYHIPPQYKKDFDLIKNGKYSQTSINFKLDKPRFYFKNSNKPCKSEFPFYETMTKILNPPLTETLTKEREYTGAFGEKQILNINQVPLS